MTQGHDTSTCGGSGVCRLCSQEACTQAFRGAAGEPDGEQVGDIVTCPECGHKFDPLEPIPIRVTEATDSDEVMAYDGKTGTGYGPRGGDPRVKELQEALNRHGLADSRAKKLVVDGKFGQRTTAAVVKAQRQLGVTPDGKVTPDLLRKLTTADKLERPRAGAAKAKRRGMNHSEAVEAMVGGAMSFDDVKEAVRAALQKRAKAAARMEYCWVYVSDLTTSEVVYAAGGDDLFQCSYEITETGEVTLGEPSEVVRAYAPAPEVAASGNEGDGDSLTEASDRIYGRVIEALDDAPDGGRVFRVRIIAYGDSKNGRRYSESVMTAASHLYEGARAYDHHRTEDEMRSSTISGLVGYYRDVEAEADGVYGDLHLLPSATHAAESLDATLAAQAAGLPPIIGVSHDVMGHYKPVVAGGRRLQEATAITKVNSADLVADPAAGGQATRMVAGGIETGTEPAKEKEGDVPTKEEILAAFKEASDEELAGIGLARAKEAKPVDAPVVPEKVTEAAQPKTSFLGHLMIEQKVKSAGLPEAVVESLTAELPETIRESDVDARIASLKTVMGIAERAGLAPTAGSVTVTQEAHDKKVAALDAMFAGDYSTGYRSFREAFADFTGKRPKSFDEDYSRTILRESMGTYDSSVRSTESMTTASWDAVLGDSITRRMVAEYSRPNLQTWRKIVSTIVPINDFRTQRIDRVGGYGVLPTVNQGAPYQPLTSPTDEEATYTITKRGGTEDLTLEMIANDDLRAIANIPRKLGLAAAQTLYRFVWDILPTNAAVTYDSTALFHTNHANTQSGALSQSNLSVLRRRMRQQTAYGDSSDVLSIVPKFLVVPSALEELAFQLCTSAVAIPSTPAGPSDTPNLHQGLEPIVIDYYSDADDWYTVADPTMCPTIELGFFNGRETPELFTQSDPTVGSMFNSDTLTYKIRHPYGGTVLEHRGFQRATN
ncbi:peptidoglycan-binding domain-containing protein [Actinomadura sp. HBU206391]|uniref:peptidoglycan-binding domain-containing protein n=1 Tax=Actinomadura sp. HBU206391 TaxID=2731692 RepID=UPI001650A3F6|nr:peptidoglycan-binding protein [Actinomadura sp. HBU206391]MBC6458417.1 peptidoglycan-binding protein [Actinomadura sp. HBU206391]